MSADIPWARKAIRNAKASFLDQVKAQKVLTLAEIGNDTLGVEIQVLRIGDMALVALPGEVFVELGLAIQKRSPLAHTLVVELANDSIGYVPTRKAFAEGSYEVVNSLIAAGGGEKMVEMAVALISNMNGRI